MTQASQTTYTNTVNTKKRRTDELVIIDFFEANPNKPFSSYEVTHCNVELLNRLETVHKRFADLVKKNRLKATDSVHTVNSCTYTRYELLPFDHFAVPKLTSNERWMRSIRRYVDDRTYEVIVSENKRLKEYGV